MKTIGLIVNPVAGMGGRVGREHILVVGAEEKMRQWPGLRVDTGDPALDETLGGYIEAAIGYRHARVMKVLVDS